jgi:hypothetical protein
MAFEVSAMAKFLDGSDDLLFFDGIDPVMVIKRSVCAEMDTLFAFSYQNPLVWEGVIVSICFGIFGVTKHLYAPKKNDVAIDPDAVE